MLSAADLRGPGAARPVLQSDLGHTRYTDKNLAGPRQRRVRLRPGRRHRRWRLRGGAAGRGRAHLPSRPGFVGGLSAEGKGRVDNVGVGILARYWFLGGTYAEARCAADACAAAIPTTSTAAPTTAVVRTIGAHAMLGHVMPLSERGQLDAYARLQWQRLGGDSVRNDAGDQLSYDATQALRTRLGARYVYAAGDQTRSTRARPGSRTPGPGARGSMARPCRARTPMAARRCWKRRALEPSPSWSLRLSAQGQFGARQGIGRGFRLSALLRRDAGSAQVGRWASTVSRICITYSPQSCATKGGVQAASAWTNRATARSRRSRPRGSPPETRRKRIRERRVA